MLVILFKFIMINVGMYMLVFVIICLFFSDMIWVFMWMFLLFLMMVLVIIWFILICLVSVVLFWVSMKLLIGVIVMLFVSLKLIIVNLKFCSLVIRYFESWLFNMVLLFNDWLSFIKFVILIIFCCVRWVVLFINFIVSCEV